MRTHWVTALLFALLVPLRSLSSQDLCSVPVPVNAGDARFYDEVESLYQRLDSVVQVDLAAENTARARTLGGSLEPVRLGIRGTLHALTRSRVSSNSVAHLFESIGTYLDFVDAIYDEDPPARVLERVCPIRQAYLTLIQAQLTEHSRRIEVRYGPLSERLNIVEMVLAEWSTPTPPMGALRDPGKTEPILRIQTLGYQWNAGANKAVPSAPTAQVGLTWYFYGAGRISRALHHVGIALAYQRDVAFEQDLGGFVLHVRDYDLGLLCATRACADPVIVGSKNISLAQDLWVKWRKTLNRR